MTSHQQNNPSPNTGRRRPRYSGMHPHRFDERYKELAPEAHPGIHEKIRAQGRTPAGTHVPVLLKEVMDSLRPVPGETIADCTLGYGGHAREFLQRIRPGGRLIGLDIDGEQLKRTRRRLENISSRIDDCHADVAGPECTLRQSLSSFHRCHFSGLGRILRELSMDGFDVIFADLGLSSMQADDPARGFSYKQDGPLDMRMDDRIHRTAADWLASLTEQELSCALWDLADEPDHEKIARSIVRHRQTKALATTSSLVALVFKAKGISRRAWRKSRGAFSTPGAGGPPARTALPTDSLPDRDRSAHPAARTFQALRIMVNDERNGLKQFLRIAPYCLRPQGRIGIISFHSGEDRIVKRAFREGVKVGVYEAASESVIRPTPMEVAANPRAKSAKLRWARKH